jgi:hypothetical protein
VKHALPVVNDLFTNTEIAKNNVQDVFDVNAAGKPAKRHCG